MQVNDKVQCLGTVRDIVDESVLVVTDDGREYWFLKQHVSMQPVPGAEEAPTTGAPVKSSAPVKSAAELESMTKAELEAYGKKLGLDLHQGMTKDDMISEIEDAAQAK